MTENNNFIFIDNDIIPESKPNRRKIRSEKQIESFSKMQQKNKEKRELKKQQKDEQLAKIYLESKNIK